MKNAIKVFIFSVAFLAVAAGVIFGIYKYYQTDFTFMQGTKSDTVIVTGYTGGLTDVKIPKKIQGKTVEAIGDGAFSGMNIKSVEFSDSILTIEANAFKGCAELESVELDKSLQSIGDSAFFGCKKLRNVQLPASVTSVGALVFNECDMLESVEAEKNGGVVVENDVIYSADKTIAYCPVGKVDFSNYKFPAELKQFGQFFFYGHDELTSFDIPDGIQSVSADMFLLCSSLENVTIPSSVRIIGNSAFLGCSSLKELYVPASVNKIENFAFPVKPAEKESEDGEKEEKNEEQKKQEAEVEKYISKGFRLIVEEKSAAYHYAVKNSIKYEIKK